MTASLSDFKKECARIARLVQINALVDWDQQTNMPPGGAEARAEHSATLSELIHGISTSDSYGELLANAEAELQGADPDDDDARLLRVARRDYDRATKLPSRLVADLARHSAISQDRWVRARAENDFAGFAPYLERMFELTREAAEHLGYEDHIYDALIDNYETGARQRQVSDMFADLKPKLVELTQAIAASGRPVDSSILRGRFPIEKQKVVTTRVVSAIGYEFSRGRQDEAAHPFCTNFSRDDVRITTRFDPGYIGIALYASMHEAGHALYEQGIPSEFDASPLGSGTSLGIHESQSRLWENLVGRSRPFARFLFPHLKDAFPDVLDGAQAEDFYRAVNSVSPSLIRIDADEVTYNLHVMLRFELECELLTGALAISDLPEAWNARMEEYLGVRPPDDAHGVLQDVHWSAGIIGYFPTYSIGNLVSGQLWHAIRKAVPNLDDRIEIGSFASILNWLRANVHRHGRKFEPGELVQMATGEPLTSSYYVDYLTAKYSDIYEL
jgi:carboxypeptidase Taq